MYRSGDYKAVCDLCGLDFWASELMEDYKHRRVDRACLDVRNMQEFVRTRTESQPEWTRPAESSAPVADYDDGAYTVTDWTLYTDYTIYVDATTFGSSVNVGNANDAGLLYATRVQVIRLHDSAFQMQISGTGIDPTNLTAAGQGLILIPNRETNTWSLFGRIR